MDTKTYETNERLMLNKQIERSALQSLADRKEAQADTLELMRDIRRVSLDLDYLLDGSFGYGAMVSARNIKGNKRTNRAAAVMQLLAVLECNCPPRHTIAAWKQLSELEQAALNVAIVEALDSYVVEA